MVMMALATTFMTAPIMSIVYPSSMNVIVRTKSKKVGSLLIEGNVIDGGAEGGVGSADGEKWALGVGGETKDQYIKGDSLLFDEEAAAAAAAFPRSSRSLSRSRSRKSNNDLKQEAEDPRKILIILTDISSVRPAMSLLQIVSSSVHHLVKVTALRLIPLDDRFGSALKVQESDEVLRTDHVLGTFKTFAQLSKTPIESIQLFITREQDFASSIASCAEENESSIIILSHCSLEPDSIAGGGELRQWGMAKQVCEIAKCSVAVMNDRGFNIGEDMSLNQKHQPEINDSSPNSGRSTSAFIKIKSLPVASARPASVFVPFIGGADDREALTLALEFQKGINTFVLVMKTKDEVGVDSDSAPVAAVVLEIDGGVFASGQEKSIPLPPYPSPSRTQPSIPQITNSAAADEDFIRILQKKINNDKDPSNVLSMETATVSQGGEYGLMMNWLRTSDLSQGDMIVFGRKMYDMFVEYSMMEAQSGGGSYYQLNTSFNGGGSGVSGGSRREHLKTVIERETGCSVCIVHSK